MQPLVDVAGRSAVRHRRALPAARRHLSIEGDRFVPGRDDFHVGGDNWSADAAIRVIEADDTWNGMMVSLGAIDKLSKTT